MYAMTRPRYDEHGTEFGSWVRKPKELQSKLGFIATDLDYIWENYKTGAFMLIEEKRYMSQMTWSQRGQLERFDKYMLGNPKYCGFHLLQFEKTNPDDGNIFWNGDSITTAELIEKLQFKNLDKAGFFHKNKKSLNQLIQQQTTKA